MRRKLYLVNEIGSTFYFDYGHACVIEELDGFGFEFEIDYEAFDARFVETKRKIPLVPLEEVLQCMQDKDEIVRKAAKAYYNQYYTNMNRLHNERPSK